MEVDEKEEEEEEEVEEADEWLVGAVPTVGKWWRAAEKGSPRDWKELGLQENDRQAK